MRYIIDVQNALIFIDEMLTYAYKDLFRLSVISIYFVLLGMDTAVDVQLLHQYLKTYVIQILFPPNAIPMAIKVRWLKMKRNPSKFVWIQNCSGSYYSRWKNPAKQKKRLLSKVNKDGCKAHC